MKAETFAGFPDRRILGKKTSLFVLHLVTVPVAAVAVVAVLPVLFLARAVSYAADCALHAAICATGALVVWTGEWMFGKDDDGSFIESD